MPPGATIGTLAQECARILASVAATGSLRPGLARDIQTNCGRTACHCMRYNDPGDGPWSQLVFEAEGNGAPAPSPPNAPLYCVQRSTIARNCADSPANSSQKDSRSLKPTRPTSDAIIGRAHGCERGEPTPRPAGTIPVGSSRVCRARADQSCPCKYWEHGSHLAWRSSWMNHR